MLLDETSCVPHAASWTFRAISCLAAPCSSTAAAMVVVISLISKILRPIDLIASEPRGIRDTATGFLDRDVLIDGHSQSAPRAWATGSPARPACKRMAV